MIDKMMKKILAILPNLSSGGAERQMLVLLGQLASRGYDTTLVTYRDVKDSYAVPSGVHRISIIASGPLMARLKLMKFLWAFDRKAIFISYIYENNRDVLALMLPLRRKIIIGERSLMKSYARKDRILYNLERKASVIISNSYSQQEWIKEHTPWLSDKVTTITNYTDTSVFRPMPELLNTEKAKIIGILGRYTPQKNCIRFASAVKQAIEQGERNFKCIWHGQMRDIRGEFKREYLDFKEFIEANGLEDYIKLKDASTDVVGIDNYCDAMCLPSLWEGFSNALSEYICCGKPVLASNISDNPIMVKDGVNGFLFDPYSVNDITSALLKYLHLSDVQQKAMGEESRKLALSLFNLDEFTRKHIEIIEALA